MCHYETAQSLTPWGVSRSECRGNIVNFSYFEQSVIAGVILIRGTSSLLLKCMNFRIKRYLFLETWQKMHTRVKVYWAHVRVLRSLCAFNLAAVLKHSLHRLQVYAGVCGGYTETLESQSVCFSKKLSDLLFCNSKAWIGTHRGVYALTVIGAQWQNTVKSRV